MKKISPDIINTIYLKEGGINEIIDECHQKFLNNDRSAIMTVIMACCVYQKLVPDWAADELLNIDEELASGRFRDLNEFFNFGKPLHKTTLEFLSNVKKKNRRVVSALYRHKVDGGDFTRCDLRGIAELLGVSHKVLEAIYKENKDCLNKLPRKTKASSGLVLGNAESLLKLAQCKRLQRNA